MATSANSSWIFYNNFTGLTLSSGGGMKKGLFVSGRETGMALIRIFLVLQGCLLAV
jgi:hypothetical protein